MKLWFSLCRMMGSRQFRGEVAGRLIDVRVGAWGDQTVLCDGAPVSKKAWAGFTGSTSHFFKLKDEEGKERNAEVRLVDRSGGFMMALRVEVSLDGRVVMRIHEVGGEEARNTCPRCGYSLEGLEAVNGEIKCPECGRHTVEELVR